MKALISPNESFDIRWISSWEREDNIWIPIYSEILDCQRVCEVQPDDKIFDVSMPLHWVSCPDDCTPDIWYFKEGQVYVKPKDIDQPSENDETPS
jgi:hypothetical protein